MDYVTSGDLSGLRISSNSNRPANYPSSSSSTSASSSSSHGVDIGLQAQHQQNQHAEPLAHHQPPPGVGLDTTGMFSNQHYHHYYYMETNPSECAASSSIGRADGVQQLHQFCPNGGSTASMRPAQFAENPTEVIHYYPAIPGNHLHHLYTSDPVADVFSVAQQQPDLLQNCSAITKPAKRKLSGDSAGDQLLIIDGELDEMPPCSVCGDQATGIHYSVYACEGCKGFFRRAMSRKPGEPAFSCLSKSLAFPKSCDINRETRNRCRACRLKRCLDVGMIFTQSARAGYPKDPAQRKRKPMAGTLPLVSPSEVEQWARAIIAAHDATYSAVSEIFTSRYAAVLSIASDQLWPPGCDLSKRGYQAVQHFAHSLPFVANLPPDLRTHLLETNGLLVMILRVASRFCPERDSFLFPPGAEVTLPCLSSTLLGGNNTRRLASLGRTLFRLGVSGPELAFLSTLALLSPDALSDAAFLPGQAGQLRELELHVLRAYQSHAHDRWSSSSSSGPSGPSSSTSPSYRPAVICKQLAILSDIRALEHSVPLQIWMEPSNPCAIMSV